MAIFMGHFVFLCTFAFSFTIESINKKQNAKIITYSIFQSNSACHNICFRIYHTGTKPDNNAANRRHNHSDFIK